MATPVIMPRQGQSVESCILVEWVVAPNSTVEQGQPLANIETDKATFEVEAPVAGTLLETFFEEGADIPVLTHIAAIGEPGEDVSSLRPEGSAAAPSTAPAVATPAPGPAVADAAPAPPAAVTAAPGAQTGVSPRARHLAKEKGVSTAGLAGSGPGGRVIERDVQAVRVAQPTLQVAAAPVAVPAAAPEIATEIPVSGIRKIIAERMHRSLATTAQLTLHTSFDATSIQSFRSRVKARAEKLGLPNVTINDLIVYATARTLRKHPQLNAHWLGDRIVQYGQVNMGVAMDTPRGLMVPVLAAADSMPLAQLSTSVKTMAESAREGSINPDLLAGGTFTITNMGMLGIETFTPVLNVPEVAILGVGGITLKPVETGEGIGHVRAINLSLTIDHQAVDGADGARFLQDLTFALEDIELMLVG